MIQGPLSPSSARFSPIGAEGVHVTGGFWSDLQALNAAEMIGHAEAWMEKLGWIGNFDAALAGELPGRRRGREFSDSDVYKLMEAMAWEHGRTGDPEMDARFRALSARIVGVQEPDGYLNTMYGRPGQQQRYSDFEFGHELYCLGHLFQAAVARARTSGEDEFVQAAYRAADHVVLNFGPQGRRKVPGHPVVEMGLVELSRLTGRREYLEQARLFVDRRGHGLLADNEWGRSYYQDRIPVRATKTAEGHAVRAMYLAAGATDVALDTGDTELLSALTGQALSTLARRTYVTGGLGSRHQGEAFGEDFELPSDRAYSETCAGIGAIQYFQRLLLATGDARFADAIERVLFNVVAASPGHDGRSFFYSNTLHCRTRGDVPAADEPSPRAESSLRAPWYEVSCCPTNVARTLASFDSLIATQDAEGVQIHQYASCDLRVPLGSAEVRLRMETDYPNDGVIRLAVLSAPANWTLSLRVPRWAEGATVDGDGVPVGYVTLAGPAAGSTVVLDLNVAPRWTWPDPRIDAVRGQVAVERGPLVLCLESVDLGSDVDSWQVDASAGFADCRDSVRVTVSQVAAPLGDWPYGVPVQVERPEIRDVALRPYHSWGNRGAATMRVWLPVAGGAGTS